MAVLPVQPCVRVRSGRARSYDTRLYVPDNDAYRNSRQRNRRGLECRRNDAAVRVRKPRFVCCGVLFCLAHRGEFFKASEKGNVLQGRELHSRGNKLIFNREPYHPFDKRCIAGADDGRHVASGSCQSSAHGRLGDHEDRRQGMAVVAGDGHRGRAACCDIEHCHCAHIPEIQAHPVAAGLAQPVGA